MANKDPYEVLGINRNATKEEIKAAYRKLAKMYHPDQYVNNPLSDLAQEKFIEVQQAYDSIMEGKAGNSYGYNQSSSQQSYQQQSYSGGYSSVNLADIRRMIERGDVLNAKLALSSFQNKNAEWYFLSGILDIRLGSYNSGLNYLNMAVNMEPNNQEYRAMYDQVRSQAGSYQRSYRTYNTTSGTMDCCCQLICLDQCCECCGGDCISCI